MFVHRHDFFMALRRARKAARRGDVASMERWLRAAERHTLIARGLDAMDEARETRTMRAELKRRREQRRQI